MWKYRSWIDVIGKEASIDQITLESSDLHGTS